MVLSFYNEKDGMRKLASIDDYLQVKHISFNYSFSKRCTASDKKY